MNVDWRWRELFRVISIGVRDERAALWHTTRLLRAKMRTDRRLAWYGTRRG